MVDATHLVAVLLALGAAASIASHHVFVRVGTDEGEVLDAVLVVMVVNVLVLLPLAVVVGYPDYRLSTISIVSFVAAGLLGSVLGRTLLYAGIQRIGASRAVPMASSWALVSTALGVVFLDESPSFVHVVGVVLVVGGAAVIAWETSRENPTDLSGRELLVGLALPVGAALAFGVEPIFANVGFAAGTSAVVGLTVKTVAAVLGFLGYLWWADALPDSSRIRRTDLHWFLLAGVASTLFLLGYYLGIAIAPVSVVVPIIVANPLFVVLFSALFVPDRLERITWPLLVASLVVVVGVVAITVFA